MKVVLGINSHKVGERVGGVSPSYSIGGYMVMGLNPTLSRFETTPCLFGLFLDVFVLFFLFFWLIVFDPL